MKSSTTFRKYIKQLDLEWTLRLDTIYTVFIVSKIELS